MLPARRRMRTSPEFRETIGVGHRAGRRTVVVYVRPLEPGEPGPGRAGFVVSKQVGNAVTRNRVKRRLRHLVCPMMEGLDVPSISIVVRALPAAATDPERLTDDLRGAFERAMAGL